MALYYTNVEDMNQNLKRDIISEAIAKSKVRVKGYWKERDRIEQWYLDNEIQHDDDSADIKNPTPEYEQ